MQEQAALSPTKIMQITPEQSARFGEWAQEWITIGLSTQPADFDKATEAALRAYALCNLARPKIILRMSSPYGATLGGALAWALLREIKQHTESQVWSQVQPQVVSQVQSQVQSQVLSQVQSQVWSQVQSQVGSQVWSQVWSQVQSQVWSQVQSRVWSQVRSRVWSQVVSQVESQVQSQVRSQVQSQVWSQVGSQVVSQAVSQVESQVRSQVWSQVQSQVWSQVRSQVWSQVGSQVRSQVESQVQSQVWSQVGSQVWSQVRSQVESQVQSQVWSQVRSQVWSQVRSAAYNHFGGSFWASWSAYITFMRDVLGWRGSTLASFTIDEDLIRSCGWVWWHEDVLAISDRPCELHRDERGRLHNDKGPSIAYRDGWALWHWHGITVPDSVILRPEKITTAGIEKEQNAEVRRVMIERYGYGRYVAKSQITHQDQTGKLRKRRNRHGDEIAAVEVRNGTPEPDGSHKTYFLSVPPQCQTATEAVAWTYGMTVDEYKQLRVRT